MISIRMINSATIQKLVDPVDPICVLPAREMPCCRGGARPSFRMAEVRRHNTRPSRRSDRLSGREARQPHATDSPTPSKRRNGGAHSTAAWCKRYVRLKATANRHYSSRESQRCVPAYTGPIYPAWRGTVTRTRRSTSSAGSRQPSTSPWVRSWTSSLSS